MIDAKELLNNCRQVADLLVDDLRVRTESNDETHVAVRGQFAQAESAGRTEKSYEEWREDLLAQVASSWVLATVFIRFCEDNGLIDQPLLSGPGNRIDVAKDLRSQFFAQDSSAGDREWLFEVFGRVRHLPGLRGILGGNNPLWQIPPTADGAKALLELWWATTDDGTRLKHDFRDPELGTRFLGDLYQDLSEHARKQYALLQTPEFVESFILDRTLDPAIETFGLDTVRMIDPTCGSGHFLLGTFERLLSRWQDTEPATEPRELVQRALDAVNGVDINPTATNIARFRLLVAALKAADVKRLSDAPDFRINVATGDSLLHGTRGGELFPADDLAETLKHRYVSEDRELADRILRADSYHAVVGNPPYITVKDPAVRDVVRALYPVCSGKYALSVPFMQRFHDLAIPARPKEMAGFVGQITANSFMKRSMGRQLVNHWMPTKDITHIIDTSGAYIPGHGTPTVVILARESRPRSSTVRAVLGIQGEPSRPERPEFGKVWISILEQIDRPGSESGYASVEDLPRDTFTRHPWSLQGGAAPSVRELLDRHSGKLESVCSKGGFLGISGSDETFVIPRSGIFGELSRPIVFGRDVRDYDAAPQSEIWFPYADSRLLKPEEDPKAFRGLWHTRTALKARRAFGNQSYETAGRPWWEWHQLVHERLSTIGTLCFSGVATHNHFAIKRHEVHSSSAPIIQLRPGVDDDELYRLLGLLNSSTACFWMKQVFHCKGSTVDKVGARQTTVPFEDFYDLDSTKLLQFPLPDGAPREFAHLLDAAAQDLGSVTPSAVAKRQAPTAEVLRESSARARSVRRQMVTLQEEMDWECYRLYGLIKEDLTFSEDELPEIEKGQRAFEIALARRMAAGQAESTWFARHGSTPITEIPAHWPEGYRELVERRLELIEEDRAIRLLERPEHKRRWNWRELEILAEEAQEQWLTDRIESCLSEASGDPEPTTVARLADRLSQDAEARQVAEDLEGATVDLTKLVGRLVADEAVPFLAAYRLKPSGLRKRAVWKRTWDLQRIEDEIDTRLASGELSESEAAVERKQRGVEKIPVPPKYAAPDYADKVSWQLRGRLDVPKERFIRYPDVHLGADASAVVGWAGWDHLEQARALASLYMARQEDGADRQELAPLIAGLTELVPWLKQWHNEPNPTLGGRMGDFFADFVETERQALGLSPEDLTGTAPLEVDP